MIFTTGANSRWSTVRNGGKITPMRFTTITKSFLPGFSMFLALSAAAPLLRADAPATQPAADAQKDSPEVKVIRDIILDADKNDAKRTLEQVRKEYHTENEK